MPDDDLKDTQPNKVLHDSQPDSPISSKEKERFPRWLVAVFIVLVITIGLLGGYDSGISQRVASQNTVAAGQLTEQFQLGTKAV